MASVLAAALAARWKTPGAALKQLFPQATEAEIAELLSPTRDRRLAHDSLPFVTVPARKGDSNMRRYAGDQEPEPNGRGQFQAGEVGPQSGSRGIEQDQGEEELERLLDELAERLPGAEDRLIRHVHDRRRRRAASDRRRVGRDRRWEDDQGTNTHAEALPRIPPVDREYDAHAKDRRGRGAHDAAPRGPLTIYDRFPEILRIGHSS